MKVSNAVILAVGALFALWPTNFVSAAGSNDRTVHVYECKPDLIGRPFKLWMRWLKVDSISAKDVPNNALTCAKEQIWGGNVCHEVVDVDGTSVPCNHRNEGLFSFGK